MLCTCRNGLVVSQIWKELASDASRTSSSSLLERMISSSSLQHLLTLLGRNDGANLHRADSASVFSQVECLILSTSKNVGLKTFLKAEISSISANCRANEIAGKAAQRIRNSMEAGPFSVCSSLARKLKPDKRNRSQMQVVPERPPAESDERTLSRRVISDSVSTLTIRRQVDP